MNMDYAPKPLWSDQRIEAVTNNQHVIYHQSQPATPFVRLWELRYVLTIMRDEYEAALGSLRARIAELETELERLQSEKE